MSLEISTSFDLFGPPVSHYILCRKCRTPQNTKKREGETDRTYKYFKEVQRSTFLPAFLGKLTFLHSEAVGQAGIEVNAKVCVGGVVCAGGVRVCDKTC